MVFVLFLWVERCDGRDGGSGGGSKEGIGQEGVIDIGGLRMSGGGGGSSSGLKKRTRLLPPLQHTLPPPFSHPISWQ